MWQAENITSLQHIKHANKSDLFAAFHGATIDSISSLQLKLYRKGLSS